MTNAETSIEQLAHERGFVITRVIGLMPIEVRRKGERLLAMNFRNERTARAWILGRPSAAVVIDVQPAEGAKLLTVAELLAEDVERSPRVDAPPVSDWVREMQRRGRQLREYPPFAGMPLPRADRLAAAFEAFNEQADSGSPGTTRGVIAAVESASTITESDAENVAAELLDELGKLGLSVPVRVGVYPLARCLARALAIAGIAVK